MHEIDQLAMPLIQIIGAFGALWLTAEIAWNFIKNKTQPSTDVIPGVLDLERYRAWRDYFAERRPDPATEAKK